MKKTFIYCCLIVMISAFSSTISLGSLNRGEALSAIELNAKLYKGRRSALPDIKAYINNNLLTVIINQNLDCEIYICVSNEEDGVIYSGSYNITQPEEIAILLDLDEGKTFLLEIETDECYFSGEF